MNQLELCRAVEAEIRKAFRGVTLGKGVSLRQAQLADQSQNVVNVFHPSASGEIAAPTLMRAGFATTFRR